MEEARTAVPDGPPRERAVGFGQHPAEQLLALLGGLESGWVARCIPALIYSIVGSALLSAEHCSRRQRPSNRRKLTHALLPEGKEDGFDTLGQACASKHACCAGAGCPSGWWTRSRRRRARLSAPSCTASTSPWCAPHACSGTMLDDMLLSAHPSEKPSVILMGWWTRISLSSPAVMAESHPRQAWADLTGTTSTLERHSQS